MTNEEHIIGLKGIKPFLQGIFLKENYEGCGELDAREVGETIDAAIYALEKQIPKKFEKGESYIWIDSVRKNGRWVNVKKKSYEKVCPVCKKRITTGDVYCRNCGQAIDWSKE